MDKTFGWKIISILASLLWLSTIVPYSASVQTSDFNYQGFQTQADAQNLCTGDGSKLLEITTDLIQSSVALFINNAVSESQMQRRIVRTNGRRSSSTFTWVNGQAINNLTVNGQDSGLSLSYGYLNSSQSGFEFIADMPTVTRAFICEGSSFCSNEFTTNGRCYKSNSEPLTWFGARNRCLDGGGDLASFDFIVDDDGLGVLSSSEWNQKSSSSFWVGLQRLSWKWLGSNSDVRYSQWYDGHPNYSSNANNECICLYPNSPTDDWKWIECDCSTAYQSICMTDSTGSSASSISVSPASVITSTLLTTSANATQSENSMSSSISKSQYSSTTASSPSPAVSSGSQGSRKTDSTSSSASSKSTSAASVIRSSSTQKITTSATATQSVNSMSSINKPQYSSTTLSSPSPAVSSGSAGSSKTDYKLAVGLGVGLGGAILIAVIIAIVIFVVRRNKRHRAQRQKPPSDPSDVVLTEESHYAYIVKNPEYDNTVPKGSYRNTLLPPTEYAELSIVRPTALQSSEDVVDH